MSLLRTPLDSTTQRQKTKEEYGPIYFSFTQYHSSLCDAPLLRFVIVIVMNCPKLYIAASAITLLSDASRISHPSPSRTRGVIGDAEAAWVPRRWVRPCISGRCKEGRRQQLPPPFPELGTII